jgi:hypothetical protein
MKTHIEILEIPICRFSHSKSGRASSARSGHVVIRNAHKTLHVNGLDLVHVSCFESLRTSFWIKKNL